MGLPWPAFFNCSLLPMPLTLSLSPSAYVFCQLSVQAFFHPLHQVKAWTFLNITHATSLLSSPSQARTSSYFSFTASFGFVIFNTILKRQYKSFQSYFNLFFTKLQSVHDSPEFFLLITNSQPKLHSGHILRCRQFQAQNVY